MIFNPTIHLSPQEALAKSYEETNQTLDQYRLDDHDDLKNIEKRIGHPMFHTEFAQRLSKVTHGQVWIEDSYRDKNIAGVYTTKQGIKTYICSFDKGAMPEFSIIVTDAADLPIKEIRGWRTVLTRLIQTRTITYAQAKSAYDLLDHQADERWRANVQQFKV